MNNNIKVSLNIVLQGRAIFSKQECLENPKVCQVLNMTKEAYDYMTSTSCPPWSSPFMWKKQSKKQRLEAHLADIMKLFNGISFTYTVFDD